jgi:ELWxxDGT repeat protein
MRQWLLNVWRMCLGLVAEQAKPSRPSHEAELGFEQLEDRAVPSTFLLKDINTYPGSQSSAPSQLTAVNDTLFFVAFDDTNGRELWKSDGTCSGTVLVRDIRPGSAGSFPTFSYRPNAVASFQTAAAPWLVNVSGTLFFIANDGSKGYELWKSDGTSSGTVLVKDIRPGSAGSFPGPGQAGRPWLTNVSGTLFFVANDGTNGYELWKSDGTSTGTVMVRDIRSGTLTSYPHWLNNVNGTLFFVANDGAHGYELWKSNGTATSTVLVKDIRPGSAASVRTPPRPPSGLWIINANVSGVLYFVANDGTHGYELWKSNGTSTGTVLVRDIRPGSASSYLYQLTDVNGTLFFAANDRLWKSDGTSSGTVLVKDILPLLLTNVNGTLFLAAENGRYDGPELWKSDGTPSGTALVKRINSPFSSWPRWLTNVNGTLFFVANDDNDSAGAGELWTSDGSSTGTVMVKHIRPGGSAPRYLTNVNGTLFFVANDGTNGHELWKSDGTSTGTLLVKEIWNGTADSDARFFTNVNGTVFFVANDGEHGHELWKTDGTSSGTVLVKDIRPGTASSDIRHLTNVNGTLFFKANDGTHGPELWKSDGTSTGTVMVLNIFPGVDPLPYPRELTNVNGTLFFRAADRARDDRPWTSDYELWKSDGTSTGTVLVKDIQPGMYGSYPAELTNVNGTLFFAAGNGTNGRELWKSDGTSSGTVMVKDIRPGTASSSPRYLTNVKGTLFFVAYHDTYAWELWKSDGTPTGTTIVRDIIPGPEGFHPSDFPTFPGLGPIWLTEVNGTLFFVDRRRGQELWKSDGTSAGTTLVRRFEGLGLFLPTELTNVNGTLFFVADDGPYGYELWKSDGTSSGTVMVKDIQPGGGGSYPRNLQNVNGTLFFVAYTSPYGAELWKSDGTAAGTVLVNDIRPGEPGSFVPPAGWRLGFRMGNVANAVSTPVPPANIGGTLFFQANDGLHGFEAWVNDDAVRGPVARAVRVLPPANGTYRAGQVLDVLVRFSEPVIVGTTPSAKPYVRLRIGSVIRNALFHSQPNVVTLRFRYTVQTGDLDTNGIEILSPVIRPTGTFIRDANGNNASTTFINPSTPNVKVDAVAPTIVLVTPPANGHYVTGQVLDILVRFSEPVNVGTTSTAKPYIRLRIGSVIRNAVFHSKPNAATLRFRYVIQSSDHDTNGIEILSPIMRPAGTFIRDLAGNDAIVSFVPPSTTGVLVN